MKENLSEETLSESESIVSAYTTTYDVSHFETSLLNKWIYAQNDYEDNPTNITNDYFIYMIDNYYQAYCARVTLGETEKAFWCFNRMGMSSTKLDDGRIIYIAGEHEDYYDPDFFIYNDVFVFENVICSQSESCSFWNSHKQCRENRCVFKEDYGYGETHPICRNCCFNCDFHKKCTAIYGYPREIFPPTDFHLTILINDDIWIIGNVSSNNYLNIYILNTTTMKMRTEITTSDEEMPMWFKLFSTCELRRENNTIILYQDPIKLSDYSKYRSVDDVFVLNEIWILDMSTFIWKNEMTTTKKQLQKSKINWTKICIYTGISFCILYFFIID